MKFKAAVMKAITLSSLLVSAASCLAQTSDPLDRLPQPWKEPTHRISFEEYDATVSSTAPYGGLVKERPLTSHYINAAVSTAGFVQSQLADFSLHTFSNFRQ